MAVAAGQHIGVAAAQSCSCAGFVEQLEDVQAEAYLVEIDPPHEAACLRWIREGK